MFSSLWPLKSDLKIVNPWEELVQPTYELIMDSKLFYSSNRQKWMSFDEIIVLSKTILCLAHENSHSLPECVVKVMESLKYPLVSLPAIYRQSLPTQSTDYLMEEKNFLEIFFKNFRDTRNKVLYLLFAKATPSVASTQESRLLQVILWFLVHQILFYLIIGFLSTTHAQNGPRGTKIIV